MVAVLGPNGSGKSTLLLALSGVIPSDEGVIELQGAPIESLKTRERALRLAAVAQDADVRFPFSCRDVVLMGRYPHQHHKRTDSIQDNLVAKRAMAITDTEALSERLITAISGGERQRVLMAKALAQTTPLLLLDEATSAMDIHRKLQIFRVLDRLNKEEDLTILAVLHDVNLAALFCKRIIFMKDGRVVADGPTDSVLTPENLDKVYKASALVLPIEGTTKRQVVFLP